MVDAGPVFPADRLAQLRIIGGQISGEQTQIAPDNILPQRLRVWHIEALPQGGVAAVPVIENAAVQQIVPHTGGVAVTRVMQLCHRGNVPGEGIQIPVENVNGDAIQQDAVVLQFPEVIAQLHMTADQAKDLPAGLRRRNFRTVDIEIVVRFPIVPFPCSRSAQNEGINFRQPPQRGAQCFKIHPYSPLLLGCFHYTQPVPKSKRKPRFHQSSEIDTKKHGKSQIFIFTLTAFFGRIRAWL